MRYLYAIILVSLLCLNLSRAQDTTTLDATLNTIQPQPPAADPNAPPPVPSTVPVPGSAPLIPNPNAQPGALPLQQDLTKPGKYAEFQSICRTNQYDSALYKDDSIRGPKLDSIRAEATQILESKEPVFKDSYFATLRDLIEYNETALFTKTINALKPKKMSAEQNLALSGYEAYARKAYIQAKKFFLKALENDKQNETWLLVLAEVYKAQRNYYEATTIYEDLNRKSVGRYLPEICEVTVMNSLNAEGEQICMTAAKKHKDNPFPLVFAGVTSREREDKKRATAYFRLSLKVKPTEMAHVCLAEIALMDDKTEEAISSFEKALEVSPKSPRALLGIASSQLKARQYDGALNTFRTLCNLNRTYEVEIRKAYKSLSESKVAGADRFIRLAQTCNL